MSGSDRYPASRRSAAGAAGGMETVPATARVIVSVMRRVPAIFVLSLCALGTVWLAEGRLNAGLVLIATAGGAATFGIRIMLAARFEARSRALGAHRTGLAPRTRDPPPA